MLADTPILDDSAIARLRGFGGEKLVRGMIELFVRNAPMKAAEAREALDCGDAAALRAALHGLKSSAGQLGALTVHQACSAVGEGSASYGLACQPEKLVTMGAGRAAVDVVARRVRKRPPPELHDPVGAGSNHL